MSFGLLAFRRAAIGVDVIASIVVCVDAWVSGGGHVKPGGEEGETLGFPRVAAGRGKWIRAGVHAYHAAASGIGVPIASWLVGWLWVAAGWVAGIAVGTAVARVATARIINHHVAAAVTTVTAAAAAIVA